MAKVVAGIDIQPLVDLSSALVKFIKAGLKAQRTVLDQDILAVGDQRIRRAANLTRSLLSVDKASVSVRQQIDNALRVLLVDGAGRASDLLDVLEPALAEKGLSFLETVYGEEDGELGILNKTLAERHEKIGEALPYLSKVIMGGPEAYLALASSQARAAQDEVDRQLERLNRIGMLLGAMIDALRGIYDSDLWQQILFNRRVALAFLRGAEDDLRIVSGDLSAGRAFNGFLYDYALDQVEAAQEALANSGLGSSPLLDLDFSDEDPNRNDAVEALGRKWNDVTGGFNDRLDQLTQAVDKTQVVLTGQRASVRGDTLTTSVSLAAVKAGDQIKVESLPEQVITGVSATALTLSPPADRDRDNVGFIITRTEVDRQGPLDYADKINQAEGLKGKLDQVRTLTDHLGQQAQALALFRNIELKADMDAALDELLSSHQRVQARQQALANLSDHLRRGQASYLSALQGDLNALADRIASQRRSMRSVHRRLEIMSALPRWQVQVATIRARAESTISPSTRADLAADEDRFRLSVAYETLIEDLSRIQGESSLDLETFVEDGKDLTSAFDQALGGRENSPGALIERLDRYYQDISRVRAAYGQMRSAMGRVPQHQSPAVDGLNNYLSSRSPLMDGLRWLVDNGQWAALGNPIDSMASLPGLTAFWIRRQILKIELTATVKDLLENTIVGRLESWHADLQEELAVTSQNTDLLEEVVKEDRKAQDRWIARLEELPTIIANEAETIQQQVAAYDYDLSAPGDTALVDSPTRQLGDA